MEDIVPEDESIAMQDITGIKREPYYDYSPHSYVTVIPVDYTRAQDAASVKGHIRQPEDVRLAECDTPHRHPAAYRSSLADHITHPPTLNRPIQPCYPSNSFVNWTDAGRTENKRQVCVFLMNKVGLCISVDRSLHITAQELLDVIFEDDQEVGLPAKAREIFSLWLTSVLIELQLKPNQRPFWIHQDWVEILTKYTTASLRKINLVTDEPVLSFQRNVFFDKREEMRALQVLKKKKVEQPIPDLLLTYHYELLKLLNYWKNNWKKNLKKLRNLDWKLPYDKKLEG